MGEQQEKQQEAGQTSEGLWQLPFCLEKLEDNPNLNIWTRTIVSDFYFTILLCCHTFVCFKIRKTYYWRSSHNLRHYKIEKKSIINCEYIWKGKMFKSSWDAIIYFVVTHTMLINLHMFFFYIKNIFFPRKVGCLYVN